MKYIVFDLELNQDAASIQPLDDRISRRFFEIIQIGAVMLDKKLNTINTFNRFVKPTFYANVNPFVSELTGITREQLQTQDAFPDVYQEFVSFISESDGAEETVDDIVFCTWGKSDIVELFRNVQYHSLNEKPLPKKYIDLQTAVSVHLGFSQKRLLKLQHAIKAFQINEAYVYHNALHDAFYTAELLKKLNSSGLKTVLYDPLNVTDKPRQRKKVVDYAKLLQQFEKMYARELSKEEQEMVQLAYKMGRTQQFIK